MVLDACFSGAGGRSVLAKGAGSLVEDETKTLNIQQSPSISPDVEKLKGRFVLRN